MARHPCLGLALWLVGGHFQAFASDMYGIHASTVLCTNPKTPQVIQVSIPTSGDLFYTPHVFAFYRQSNESVTISFDVTDAVGREVVWRRDVALQSFSRRLDVLDSEPGIKEEAAEPGHYDAPTDGLITEEEFLEGHGAPPRQLSSRRRGGGSSSRSSGSRSTSGSRYTSSGSTSAGLRRRASAAAARRRGSPASSATQNQPMTGVGGSRYENQNGQAYGYTSSSNLNSQYGGQPPQTTNYGYSGAGAYSSRPSSNMPLAGAALGGAALGMGGMYMYNSMNSWCDSPTGFTSCLDCHRELDLRGSSRRAALTCLPQQPRYEMNRDDLMDTGFWPSDWIGPVNVTIYDITGPDFGLSGVCPPAGWNVNWTNVTVGPIGLYMALVAVQELGDQLQPDENGDDELGFPDIMKAILIILSNLCCCGVAVGVAFFIFRAIRQRNQQQMQHQQPYEGGQPYQQPYQAPYQGGQPYQQPYQAPYQVGQPYQQPCQASYQPGQPAQQLYQAQTFQPQPAMGQTPVVMGSVVEEPSGGGFRPGQY